MSQFRSLITLSPLGLLYGSAGGFLSPENLVGRSNSKFPPDSATIAGLLLRANQEHSFMDAIELKREMVIAGPFWATRDEPDKFYVPIPWHRIIEDDREDEWVLKPKENDRSESKTEPRSYLNQYQWHRDRPDLKPKFSWHCIQDWDLSTSQIRNQSVAKHPWKFIPFLHPKIKDNERHVVDEDGLFLENAVQMDEDYCLVYVSNLDPNLLSQIQGWHRLGGEGHLVELDSQEITPKHKLNKLLHNQKIEQACALITPGVWGSNSLSYRYPQPSSFPDRDLKILTDKPIPFRYRTGKSGSSETTKQGYDARRTGQLSRGRYAVPPGTVYVFREPLNLSWWDFPDEWFPKEGFPLKHLGCGLCLPVEIQGLPKPAEAVVA